MSEEWKNRTFTFNDIEIPLPESVEPDIGRKYYTLDSCKDEGCSSNTWIGDSCDITALRNGFIYLRKEDLKKVIEALRELGK